MIIFRSNNAASEPIDAFTSIGEGVWALSIDGQQRLYDVRRRFPRAIARSPRTLVQAHRALGQVTIDSLVASLAADLVVLTKLRDRKCLP